MKIKMSVQGADTVRAELRNGAKKVQENSRKEMHRAADRIVKQAKLNAPVESGSLEESIRKERSTGDNGRLQIDVVAGEGLEPYATIMHESDYKLGPDSQDKQDQLPGVKVGRKYLSRAVTKENKTIREGIAASVSAALSGLIKRMKG